jgi:uncharacterized phage protein (TIGR01671 family)
MTPKFRTWLKNDKAMVFVASLPFPNTKGRYQEMAVGFWMDADYFFSDDDGIDYTNIDDCVLMQSTGLNDKNGREIYEGDIVKVHYVQADDEGYGQKSVFVERVSYSHGGFYFGEPDSDPSGLDYMHEFEPEDVEVIGNIYENPELLKEDK